MERSLEDLFKQAALDSKTLTEKPDNETLLSLYSLYKQGSHGDVTEDAPSNPFDFVARAKHEAWSAIKGKSKEAAMQEYIDMIGRLKG